MKDIRYSPIFHIISIRPNMGLAGIVFWLFCSSYSTNSQSARQRLRFIAIYLYTSTVPPVYHKNSRYCHHKG